jgi:hypothetical protein
MCSSVREKFVLLLLFKKLYENVTVTGIGLAPTTEPLSLQLGKSSEKFRLITDPLLVLFDNL